jgi:hypothetical protein
VSFLLLFVGTVWKENSTIQRKIRASLCWPQLAMSTGSSDNTYAPWYWVLGVLYVGLALAAAYRLVMKLRADGGHFSRKSAIVLFIYASLISYGLVRGIVITLTALDEVPHDQSLSETMFDMIPALLFCVLQTALVAKWVGHVSDIMFVLHHQVFSLRRPVIIVSIICCAITALLAIATAIDESHASPLVDRETWVQVLNSATGVTYCVNGIMFGALGVMLRSIWQPSSASDVAACRRIIAIAVLFGGVCVVRGVALIVFAGRDQESSKVVSSHWGSPLMLTLEWIALVTSLFGFTNVGGSAAGASDPSQSEPMIGSQRNIFGSSRRITFATRSLSNTSSGQQLQSLPPALEDEDDPYGADRGTSPRNRGQDRRDAPDIASTPVSVTSMAINDAGE